MTAQEQFTQWVRGDVTPLLKGRGFTRSGQIFRAPRGENRMLIAFQKSVKSSADHVVFTATLGVWSHRVAQLDRPGEMNQQPSIDQCHWTRRRGELLSEQPDHWWTLTGTVRDAQVTQDVAQLLTERALPLLSQRSSDEELRDVRLTGNAPGLTEFQRLMYLSSLLRSVGPAPALGPVLDELRKETAGTPLNSIAKAHISRLMSPGKHECTAT